MQRGQFIDVCTQWIASDETASEQDGTEDDAAMGVRSCADVPPPATDGARNLVYTLSELSSHAVGACSFCGERSTHLAVANPYTHRCFILLCDTCVG